jgi:selT/selW/selH-like putative selenoprotein
LGVEAKLVKSGGGVFEVMADKKLIFSKKKEHRFPEPQEVIESLKKLQEDGARKG